MTAIRFYAFVALAEIFASTSLGQNILMKDGRIVATKGLRRQGDTIMATVELPTAATADRPAQAATGEVGYPLSQIARLDFPEPTQLRSVPDMVLQGKGAEALALIDPIIRYYEGFRDAPGSWWGDAAMLKVEVLLALENTKDAEILTSSISHLATEPEISMAASALGASTLTRRGDSKRAIEICDKVLKEAMRPDTLALAALGKGEAHIALKQYEDAVLAYLQLPVFYPKQKLLLHHAMLGAARAYAGLEDLPRARATLVQLIKEFPASPQVPKIKSELGKIDKREKALAPPK